MGSGGAAHRGNDDDLARLIAMLHFSREYFYRRVETIAFEERHRVRHSAKILLSLPPGGEPDLTDPDPVPAITFRRCTAPIIRRLTGRPSAGDDQAAPATAGWDPDGRSFISVGLFAKTRIPDLHVKVGPVDVAVMESSETAAVLASAIHQQWDEVIASLLASLPSKAARSVADLWSMIEGDWVYQATQRILEVEEAAARRALVKLWNGASALATSKDPAERAVGDALLGDEIFWTSLDGLCGTTHVIAEVPNRLLLRNHLTVVTVTYTDKWIASLRSKSDLRDTDLERATSILDRVVKWSYRVGMAGTGCRRDVLLGFAVAVTAVVQNSLIWIMAQIGVTGTAMRLQTPNADHSQNFYVLLDLPEDVSCNRFYWSANECRHNAGEFQVATGLHWVSAEELADRVAGPPHDIIADLQVRRSSEYYALAGLALLLAFVCGYFYRNPVLTGFSHGLRPADRHFSDLQTTRQLAVATGTLLVGAPGVVITYLVSKVSDLGSYLSRGLKVMCSVGAASAVFAGFCMAALLPDDPSLYRGSFLLASVVNLIAGLTVGAALMPRGQQHGFMTVRRARRSATKADEHGRPKNLRKSGLPADGRYRQRRWGLLGGFVTVMTGLAWVCVLTAPSDIEVMSDVGFGEFVEDAYEAGPLSDVARAAARGAAAVWSIPHPGLAAILAILASAVLAGLRVVGGRARAAQAPAAPWRRHHSPPTPA